MMFREMLSPTEKNMRFYSYFAKKFNLTILLPDFEILTQQKIRENIILVH